METNRIGAALLVISLLLPAVRAQELPEAAAFDHQSEDQLIAEAIWSLIDFGTDSFTDVRAAFRLANRKYPKSAKVAYWQGRLLTYTSDRARAFGRLSEFLQSYSEEEAEDSLILDPIVQRKLASMRNYATTILERIGQLAALSNAADTEGFELSLLQAASRDPTLIAAWAGLLESSDKMIALTAADAWANQEPDNALPLYAKAVVLTRDTKQIGTEPIDIVAIEAMELGNSRASCRAPDEPWPTNFRLTFPDLLPRNLGEFASKPVSQQMFRKIVEEMFFRMDAIGDRATISESSLRNLGELVLSRSHRLSVEDDVRYLRAFAGVGVHMVSSNRILYGMTGGSVDRILNRLESIAVDQRDFDNAGQIASVRDYVVKIGQRIAKDFRSSEPDDDPTRTDRNATRVMRLNKRSITIPSIDFNRERHGPFVISDNESSPNVDMVHIDLFYSSDNRLFARRRGQQIPDDIPNSDALAKLGYSTFAETIENVRSANRNQKLRRGVFFLVDNKYLGGDIAAECFANGYAGKRDACIVAFVEREQLESFREYYGYVDVRVAQVLAPRNIIRSSDLNTVSPKADAVVVPVNRLIDSNGKVPSFVRSSKINFIVAGSQVAQRKELALVKRVGTVIGVLDSPAIERKNGVSGPSDDER